jgi:hypothetical protein
MGGGAYSGMMTGARQDLERASANDAIPAARVPRHILAAR